jgi:hypothetical protein
MPVYFNSGTGNLVRNPVLPTVLMPGDEKYLFGTVGANPIPGTSQNPTDDNVVTEAVTVNERSISVQLGARPGGGSPAGVMVQAIASANPGAAEIDVQDAAVDADGAYLTQSTSTAYKITTWTALGDGSGRYIGTTELQPEGGRFISLKVIANPNAVSYTAKIIYV